MSWHFSRALVAELSAVCCLDGGPFAESKLTPTPSAFVCSDRTTEFSRLTRFGMTFGPFEAHHGEELLMSYLAGFPAKTSARPGQEKDSTESGAGYGWKWPGSFAKYDQDTFSWRTRQCSLLGGLDEFSETWPNWGLMRHGECSALMTWGSNIRANASGLLPTVTVCGNYNRAGASATSGDGTATVVKRLTGYFPAAEFYEVMMGWPEGWTELKPLETDKFQTWLERHSRF